MLKAILLSVALLPAVGFSAEPQSTCSPSVLAARTEFPALARAQAQHGVVRIAMTLRNDGYAQELKVARSSGHVALDRAALDSVRKHWRFDVSRCSAPALAVERVVDVVYRRSVGLTVSGTLNRKFRESTAKMAADAKCDVTKVSSDTKIFACRDEAAMNLARK